MFNLLTAMALDDVFEERRRQDEKWGPVQDIPNIHPGWKNYNYGLFSADGAKSIMNTRMREGTDTFTDILYEEFAEAVEEAAKGDLKALREELIQVAAVAVKWVEHLDRARANAQ